jgi:hypothetical protein
MEIKVNKEHHAKYAALVAKHYALIKTPPTFMGLTPEEMRAAAAKDPHLNNVGKLSNWDFSGGWLTRYMSQGEAVCTVKHWAKFRFAGCVALFE